MGLPIEITCATNINDTVHRAITFGEYFPKEVSKTIAPAMDIQVYQWIRLISKERVGV